MSLDLANKNGVALASTPITDATAFAVGIFDLGDSATMADEYKVKVDTSAGDVTLDTLPLPSTLTFLEHGDEVTFIKVTTDANTVIVDDQTPGAAFDGFTGVIYSYVNRQGESITLIANGKDDKWGVKI